MKRMNCERKRDIDNAVKRFVFFFMLTWSVSGCDYHDSFALKNERKNEKMNER
jgi:hypothetical protein